jgi:capsule polysaccharide export protein KpsE/RkpR
MRRVFFEGLVNESKTKMAAAEHALKTSGIDGNVLKLSATAALEGVARLKAEISVQEVKLGSMRGYLADSAPEFRQAQTELQALRTQLTQSDKEDTKSAGQSDYVSNFREFKYQEALLELYLRQYEMARLDEGREGAVVQVVDAAQPPELKSSPMKARIAKISTLAAALALLVFVFIRNGLRSKDQTPESAEKLTRLRQSWRKALGCAKST